MRIDGTAPPLVISTARKHGPSVLGLCPEQMMGSESRMQGKESSKQKADAESTAGIDVCKSWLDVHVVPQGHSIRVSNDARGHDKLTRWLGQREVGLVVMEATGKWHRNVHGVLHRAGFRVAVVNPRRTRLFAEVLGELAKTDKVDARILALFGASLSPPARPPAPETMQALQELVTARDTAVREQTRLQNQLAAAMLDFVRRQLRNRIDRMEKDIAQLTAEMQRLIRADEVMVRRYAILCSLPGVAAITAATLIAKMDELGSCSAKQIAALAGLAPFDDQSGDRDGQKAIRAGRGAVRRALYLCAPAARRGNAAWNGLFDRLVARGKPKKLARTAVARKLLIAANTLIAEDRLWQPQSPLHA